jgi:hypothetical protein
MTIIRGHIRKVSPQSMPSPEREREQYTRTAVYCFELRLQLCVQRIGIVLDKEFESAM